MSDAVSKVAPEPTDDAPKNRHLKEADKAKDTMPYDELKEGPIANRGCTDCLCCLIFIAFLVGMVGTAGYGFLYGDAMLLLTAWDGDGNGCGYSDETLEYPLLYWPIVDYDTLLDAGSDVGATLDNPAGFASSILGYSTCVKECPSSTSTVDCKQTQFMIDDAAHYLGECIYYVGGYTDAAFRYDTEAFLGKFCMPTEDALASGATAGLDYFQAYFDEYVNSSGLDAYLNDIMAVREALYYGCITAFFIGFIYLIFLRMFGGCMVYCSILAILVGVCWCGGWLYLTSVGLRPDDYVSTGLASYIDDGLEAGTDAVDTVTEVVEDATGTACDDTVDNCCGVVADVSGVSTCFPDCTTGVDSDGNCYPADLTDSEVSDNLDGWQNNYKTYEYGAYVAWGFFIILGCCVLCNWNNIKIGVAVMKCTAAFIGSTPQIFLVPPLAIVLITVWILVWIISAMYIASVGEIGPNPDMPFITTVEWTDETRYVLLYSLFGFLWIMNFIIGASQFIVSAAAAIWYFTSTSDSNGKGSIMKGFYWVFRYHLGSIAFGAFIIAVVQMIRIIFEYYRKQLEAANQNNKVVKILLATTSYCLMCIERFVKFITKNAYIQMAITGKNFCASAWNAFILIMKNALRFGTAQSIGFIFNMLGIAFISMAQGAVIYAAIMYVPKWEGQAASWHAPVAVGILEGLVAGALFMSMFSFSSDTILQCFLVDEDLKRPDGNRPAIMNQFMGAIQKSEDEDKKANAKD